MEAANKSGPGSREPLAVHIHRDMWGELFMLTLPNGHTEEFEPEEVRNWFKVRGANMDVIEKSLDHAWNFQDADVEIENPKEPPVTRLPYAPDI